MSEDVSALVSELSREEKVRLTHGATAEEGTATGYLPGVERLGIPEVRMTDGPLGVRTDDPATAFPSTLALASTFDPSLAEAFGRALGREATARNQNVLLGPGTNLVRVPHCGRNFEYLSEDPIHAGAFAAAVVRGIQSEDVVATAKHFVANNQETGRATVSAEVDERVLRELYLPAFHDAVAAGAGSVMSAYNRINGTYASEHRHLLTAVLKEEWGFEGYVVSDWFGTEGVVEAATAGLDVQMPGVPPAELFASMDMSPEEMEFGDAFADGMPDPTSGGRFAEELGPAVERGDVPERRLDDMVERVLRSLDEVGHLDGPDGPDGEGAVGTPEHRDLAERIATQGTVLLSNDGLLPLDGDADVALLGPNVDEAILGGGGSSEVTPFTQTSPVEGVRDRAEGSVTVARGHPHIEDVSLFDAFEGDQADGEEESGDGPTVEEAVAAAEDADVAVVFVRDTATEAADRDTLSLPEEQDALVSAVADANPNTVVVANVSGPVEMPWRDSVAATLVGWYPGQAHGDAAASVLFGDADPGGRLPVTFAPEDAYPTAAERRFPGVDGEVHYEEGLLVGYRHFDATDAEPTYPYGHGRSYAEFAYEGATAVDDSTVEVTVANVGDRAGREVVQAYVDSPEATDDLTRPPRDLGGFAAVRLDAGERATVAVDLDERAVGRYDGTAGWTAISGTHTVHVGRSSRDLRDAVELSR